MTGPARSATRRTPLPRVGEIDAATPVGEIYLASLLREQQRLAVVVLGTLFLVLGAVPLVFHLWPSLAAHRLAGIPVAWWALGVLAYPFLFTLGAFYVRRAERNERDFAALVDAGGEDA
ncbi:hypothetical protein [Nocardioides phosphati]|uniref:hypothetical protein n=1 Tax=Nocardioides phosphati TaxID=1867775 RepID=UPI001E3888EF|nr:hypothetical protein [Nocardioides phosphati]